MSKTTLSEKRRVSLDAQRWAACVALGLGSVGCVTSTESPPPRSVVVSQPPPPPLAETAPPPPNERASWIAGYWHWTGVEYAWVPGHWIEGGTGMSYAPARYFNQRGQHLYQPGVWQPGGVGAAAPGR